MKTINHVTLIGAGGTGSMTPPAIVPTKDVTIYDGDDYEERNINRQIYAIGEVGNNKADVMVEKFKGGNHSLTSVPAMLRGNERIKSDLIVCCVDNNEGRKACRSISMDQDIPLIICGNEEWEPMAWLFLPEFQYTNRDPFGPRWKLDKLTEGRQETCDGVEIVAENKQLPGANFGAAGHAVHIIHSLETMASSNNYIAEIISTPWPQFKKVSDIPITV